MCSVGSCQTRFEFLSQFRKVRNAFECFVTQVQMHLPKTKRVWPMKINVICTVLLMHYLFHSSFHHIVHSISHFIGVSSCMLYIYIWSDHYRLLDNKRLDLGGVRLIFYTMLV